jgi:hypothetical protein
MPVKSFTLDTDIDAVFLDLTAVIGDSRDLCIPIGSVIFK